MSDEIKSEAAPNINEVLRSRLINRRLLSAAAKGLTSDQLDKAIAILHEIKQQTIEREEAERRAREQEEAGLREIYELAKAKNILPERMAEFFGAIASEQKEPKKLPPKYRMRDDAGVYEWGGKGPAPHWLKQAEDSGRNRDEFLIGDDGLTALERSAQQIQA